MYDLLIEDPAVSAPAEDMDATRAGGPADGAAPLFEVPELRTETDGEPSDTDVDAPAAAAAKPGKKKAGKGKGAKNKAKAGAKAVKAKEAGTRAGAGSLDSELTATSPVAPPVLEREPAIDEAPAKPAGRWRSARIASVVAVAAALLVLPVILVFVSIQLGNEQALDSARTSAVTAATTYATELAGYDYRHLDQDFGVVLAHSTPSFRQSFSQSSDALKATLLKFHATAKAKVVAAGLVSATTSKAVVLVLVDQTVSNSTQKAPTTDRSQVEITLVPGGGGWLIDQVTLL